MDLQFDLYAVIGAAASMLLITAYGAWRDGKFSGIHLLDSLGGAVSGALLVPGLADIATTDPAWERMLTGAILALGVKFGLRQLFSKPMQDSAEKKGMEEAMTVLADNTVNLSATRAIALGEQIVAAKTPDEVTAIVAKIVPTVETPEQR